MAHNIYEPGKPHKGVYHAYVRVSTDKQDIERQKHVIKTFLNGGKHEVKWYIDEGYSGRLPFEDRPALNACLKDAVKSRKRREGAYNYCRLLSTISSSMARYAVL